MLEITKSRSRVLREAFPECKIDLYDNWMRPKVRSWRALIDTILDRRWSVNLGDSGEVAFLYGGAENVPNLLDKLRSVGYTRFVIC